MRDQGQKYDFILFHFFITAGTPATMTLSGTSLITAAPAATTAFSPMVISLAILHPVHSQLLFPTRTCPHIAAFGDKFTPSPTRQSCSTITEVFTMHAFPTAANGFMTALANTTVPGPIDEKRLITAEGCISVAAETPFEHSLTFLFTHVLTGQMQYTPAPAGNPHQSSWILLTGELPEAEGKRRILFG